MKTLVAQFAFTAVRRVADVGLHPLNGRRPEQGLDGVRHGVLLGQPPAGSEAMKRRHSSWKKTSRRTDVAESWAPPVESQKHLGSDGTEVHAGLAAHPHDVLEAVEARSPSDVDGLAAVCSDLTFDDVELPRPGRRRPIFLALTFNTDRHDKE